MTGAHTVYRHEIPVDDQWHTLPLTGAVLHAAARHAVDVVEIWTLHTGGPPVDRAFRIYGTGHPFHPDDTHHKVALAPGGLVWHVIERHPAREDTE